MSEATRLLAGALVRRALRGEGAPPVPHLLVRPPGGAEEAVALPPELTVGRDPSAGLVLSDAGASRRHARLLVGDDGSAEVEDLGSKNGLRLNGRRLPRGRAPLRDGDELTLGATVLRYVDPAAGPPGQRDTPSALAAAPRQTRPWWLLAASAGLLALAAALLLMG